MADLAVLRKRLTNSANRIEQINSKPVEQGPSKLFDNIYREEYWRQKNEITLAGLRLDHDLRQILAVGLFLLMCAWTLGVLCIVVLNGWHVTIKNHRFELDREVIIALIASTVLSNLLNVVVQSIFKSRDRGGDS